MKRPGAIALAVAITGALAPAAWGQPALPSLFDFRVSLAGQPDLAAAPTVDVRVQLRETTGAQRVLHEEVFAACVVPPDRVLSVMVGFRKRLAREQFLDRAVVCEIAARPAGRGDFRPVGEPCTARLMFEKPKTLTEKLRLDRWVILGLAGQLLFTMRFLIQWIATERRRESTIPIAFWWCSLGGGLTVLAYGLIEREPIIILGQSCAFIVYLRNLYFIYRNKSQVTSTPIAEDTT